MTKEQFRELLRAHAQEFYQAGMLCEPMGTDRGHEIERELLAWFPAEPEAKSRPTCKTCGTHEVSLEQTCHNSACAKYAKEITVYEGWRDPPQVNRT